MTTAQSLFISPPNIEAQLSGAVQCIKNARQTTLVYCDGSQETVRTNDLEAVAIDWSNWFSIVSGIQSVAKKRFVAANSIS